MKIPSSPPIQSIQTEHIVSFHDTDAIGFMWHGHYIRFMECAREALFRKLNYSYQSMFDSGYVWPIIDLRVKYIKPISFDQTIQVHAYLVECEHRLKFEYIFYNKENGEKTTTAYTTQVAVFHQTKEMLMNTPDVLLEKLGVK